MYDWDIIFEGVDLGVGGNEFLHIICELLHLALFVIRLCHVGDFAEFLGNQLVQVWEREELLLSLLLVH